MQKDNPNVNMMDTPDQAQGLQDQDKTQNQGRDRAEGDSDIQDPTGVSDHLPGGGAVWKDSVLGHPQKWSNELQSYALTLSTFPYPAAVYLGEELILLHNEAWTEAGGKAEQGLRQRGTLTAYGFWALSSALHGGQQKKITSRELREPTTRNSMKSSQYLSARCLLSIVQSGGRKGPGASDSSFETAKGKVNISELGTGIDNIPLDEHPFFQRFAEMLPSRLAILDHKAQCVFVNQHFYKLTTHKGNEQNFMSWPQSIHKDDYKRVMDAYQEALVKNLDVVVSEELAALSQFRVTRAAADRISHDR
ncbi:hypothetical protein LTR17_027757 [Elasticomyces elasticus]|nr:hypothetical protein LTR17_027757 [Elasticomyces elasticus]